MIESASENSIIDLEKIEYKRQNAISDDERTETILLLNDNITTNFSIKLKCIHITIILIALVAITITILIITGKFSS